MNIRLIAIRRPRARLAIEIAAVIAGVLLPFLPYFFYDTIPFEDDLANYFWPVMHSVAVSLRAGHLPLWSPEIFSGFPLLADPESGVFYPLNWVLVFVDGAAGMRFVLVGAATVSAISVFLYARNLGLGFVPASVASWVMALGGFATGHLVHVSISNSAGLLPLLLLSTDKAFASSRRQRVLWFVFAAGIHCLQWLGGHVQPPLMSLLLVAAYALFRTRAKSHPAAWHLRMRRSLAWLIIWPSAILAGAISAAAIQVLPTVELAMQSSRASPASSDFAASYQFSLFDLLALVWPYFFQSLEGMRWGLWANWETAGYVGILPLMLAAFAVMVARHSASPKTHGRKFDKLIGFYAVVVVLTLWLSLGKYVPVSLYTILETIPPFNLLRASARYLFLFDFALAMLAAFGAEAILQEVTLPPHWRSRFVWCCLIIVISLTGLAFACAAWIGVNTTDASAWLDTIYRGSPNSGLLPEPVRLLDYLKESVWLGTPHFAQSTAILLISALALFVLIQGQLTSQTRGAIVISLTLLDLSLFASGFWQSSQGSALYQPDELTSVMNAERERGRFLDLRPGVPDSNLLLPWGVADSSGYSSLVLSRQAQVHAAMVASSNRLLDLDSVTWLAVPTRTVGHSGDLLPVPTKFDLRSPILNLSSETPLAERSFIISDSTSFNQLLLVSALAHAPHIPQGMTIGRIIVKDDIGTEHIFPVRAGLETAEWALERSDVALSAQHGPAPIAYSQVTQDEVGAVYNRHLFAAAISLLGNMPVHRAPTELRFEVTASDVHWLLYDLTFDYRQRLNRFDLATFRDAYVSGSLRLVRNVDALPRAFLVHQASTLPAEEVLRKVIGPDFEPQQSVLLEESAPQPQTCDTQAEATCKSESVSIVDQSADGLHLHIEASADAYLMLADTWYPGWVAREGITRLPIYRGDYLYRAVFIPRGQHDLLFTFEPPALWVGGLLSVLSIASGICLVWWGMAESATAAAIPPCA